MNRMIKAIVLLGAAVIGAATPAWASGRTERVSVGRGGVQAATASFGDSISADRRFVLFDSDAGNLVAGDENGLSDVFIRDRLAGTTTMITRDIGGGGGDGPSFGGQISADGRFVSFVSAVDGFPQAYLYDRKRLATRLVSISAEGALADQGVSASRISSNGRYLGFSSFSTNLVPGDTNDTVDVFVYDRKNGKISRESVTRGGGQVCDIGASGGIISGDGRFVSIETRCPNMVAGPSNGESQAYVRDRRTGKNERVSVGPDGAQANGFSFAAAFSADGRFVSIFSRATNLVPGGTNSEGQVFVRDRKKGETELVSVGLGGVQGNGFSSGGQMSADGRFVIFSSDATNLVAGDTNGQFDTFIHDRLAGTTKRINVGPGRRQANGRSFSQNLAADGRTAVFSSEADNLVPGDTNGDFDVFVHTR